MLLSLEIELTAEAFVVAVTGAILLRGTAKRSGSAGV